MKRLLFLLIVFLGVPALATENSYRCFDVYNFYGNLRYEYFNGETDFQTIKNMIAGGDRGTLTLVLNPSQAHVQGFDEKIYDGTFIPEASAEGRALFYSLARVQDFAKFSLELTSYQASDTPTAALGRELLKATFRFLEQGEPGSHYQEFICGLESSNGKTIEWEPLAER